MKQYIELLNKVMTEGTDQFNERTGKICRFLVGYQMQFNMADGFPLVTTRKAPFKSIVGELLGFFRGYDNAADFRSLGCKFWDGNANETEAWLKNPNRKGTDDLGRIYGKQWAEWLDTRVVHGIDSYSDHKDRGYEFVADIDSYNPSYVVQRKINQLENALRTIMINPSDRRIIVTGWNPAEMDLQALPACHMDYRFVPVERANTLHVVMTIRSWDLFLGAPANIAETALFLHLMCALSGYHPGTVTIQATNAHIYEDHFEQIKEQLTREPHQLPTILVSDELRISSEASISGVFTRIQPTDVELLNYTHHDPLFGEMAR
jgi:thymidylate synthase